MRTWDNDKGWRDFTKLGGLSKRDLQVLDAAVTDVIRRRMLTAWFGREGARWGWSTYQRYRREEASAQREIPNGEDHST